MKARIGTRPAGIRALLPGFESPMPHRAVGGAQVIGDRENRTAPLGSPRQSVACASLGSISLLDRDAVHQAFNEFVSGSSTTPDQLEFIDLIVSELTANGLVQARRLYESPDLDSSPQGPEALFPGAKVHRMSEILDDFKRCAAA